VEAEVYARAEAPLGARGATGPTAAASGQTFATDRRRCKPPHALELSSAKAGLSWKVTQSDGSSMDWELVADDADLNRISDAELIPIRRERPLGHSYSANVITKAVELVLSANSSFRGAARSLQILCVEAAEECPSLWSIRNGVLRLGLYELERPKRAANDWAFIVDHTIQVGPHKALLVLGVQLGDLNQNQFALGHQDVTVLALEICEQSNAKKS
jgi:hypothetical protein